MIKANDALIADPAVPAIHTPGRKHMEAAACQHPAQAMGEVRAPRPVGRNQAAAAPLRRDLGL